MLTQEILKEFLHYDSETGIFHWIKATNYRIKIGNVAGCLHNGYVDLKLLGKSYKAHRLAWLYINGVWPMYVIDHINGDPSDNRICNLRSVTQSQNCMNKRKNTNSLSGYKGASWKVHVNKWLSQIKVDNKVIFLGYFNTPEEANAAYKIAADKYHGEFANYG